MNKKKQDNGLADPDGLRVVRQDGAPAKKFPPKTRWWK
jgi:hypothetical protein